MSVSAHYDDVTIGGGSAGSVLPNHLGADPSGRVLVLGAGRPDYIWDIFIHMPTTLTFPSIATGQKNPSVCLNRKAIAILRLSSRV